MHFEANKCSANTIELRPDAASVIKELNALFAEASKQLVARSPAEYGTWGIIKTRAY